MSIARGLGVSRSTLLRSCERAIGDLALYSGVQNTLAELHSRGIPLGVVTSVPGPLAELILKRLRVDPFLQAVVHAGRGKPYKPHPEPIRRALTFLDLPPTPAVIYAGDTETDAVAATSAGVSFAWAAYGYGLERPAGSTFALGTFADLLRL
jgi:phosphoglycolate phosphatase-like HAD superfamily hydrolase